MNSNHLIRVVIAGGLIAAIGCADGQRSSNDRAGKGKKMSKAFDPSTKLVNGKPSKTADSNGGTTGAAGSANEAAADNAIDALEADLKIGTEIQSLPDGDFRLASSVTVYRLNDTNEQVHAATKVVYADDNQFTPRIEDLTPVGKFKSATVDKGVSIGIPMTFSSLKKKVQTATAALFGTKVVNSSNKISIQESFSELTEETAKSMTFSAGELIEKKSVKTKDGIVASGRLLKTMNNEVRLVVMIEEPGADANSPKVNRNVYLTFKPTSATNSGAGSQDQAEGTTPGASRADATPRDGADGLDGASGAEVDPTTAAATKTK